MVQHSVNSSYFISIIIIIITTDTVIHVIKFLWKSCLLKIICPQNPASSGPSMVVRAGCFASLWSSISLIECVRAGDPGALWLWHAGEAGDRNATLAGSVRGPQRVPHTMQEGGHWGVSKEVRKQKKKKYEPEEMHAKLRLTGTSHPGFLLGLVTLPASPSQLASGSIYHPLMKSFQVEVRWLRF